MPVKPVEIEEFSMAATDVYEAIVIASKRARQIHQDIKIELNQRIETLNLRTVRQRLAQYLLAYCGAERSSTIELTIKKLELAKHLGTISETLSRTFRRLERDGLIAVKSKCIRVLDCGRLKQELNT